MFSAPDLGRIWFKQAPGRQPASVLATRTVCRLASQPRSLAVCQPPPTPCSPHSQMRHPLPCVKTLRVREPGQPWTTLVPANSRKKKKKISLCLDWPCFPGSRLAGPAVGVRSQTDGGGHVGQGEAGRRPCQDPPPGTASAPAARQSSLFPGLQLQEC